jgi:site-specific recombinase XerD
LRTLKAIVNKAVEWKRIQSNNIKHIQSPKINDSKPYRYFTLEELAALYAACAQEVNKGKGPQPNALRAHVWRLFANTGMRRAEGLALRWEGVGRQELQILSSDDDPDDIEQRVTAVSGRTKSGKWRTIPLTDGARDALKVLRTETYHTGFVIPQVHKNVLSRQCIRDCIRANIGGSIHVLRHTYISHLVMAGLSLRTVQVLAGHSSYSVTEKYAHLSPGYLQNAGRMISL